MAHGRAEAAVCPDAVVCNGQLEPGEVMTRAEDVHVSSPVFSFAGGNDFKIDPPMVPQVTAVFEPRKEVFALADVE